MEGRTDRHGGSYHMNLRGVACALAGGALWGFSGTAVSYLFRSSGIDPMWVMSVRMVLAGILFLLFSVARGDRRPFELLRDKSAVRDLLLFAGAGKPALMLGDEAVDKFLFDAVGRADDGVAVTVQLQGHRTALGANQRIARHSPI